MKLKTEQKKDEFICNNCEEQIFFSEFIGTLNRNHCPYCLWSKHLDLEKAGDRKSNCKMGMKPIGLTFKQKRVDKYGKIRQGELMLIHKCVKCGKISINRLAGDDNSEIIMKIFEESQKIDLIEKNQLEQNDIKIIGSKMKKEIIIQLFGNDFKN